MKSASVENDFLESQIKELERKRNSYVELGDLERTNVEFSAWKRCLENQDSEKVFRCSKVRLEESDTDSAETMTQGYNLVKFILQFVHFFHSSLLCESTSLGPEYLRECSETIATELAYSD